MKKTAVVLMNLGGPDSKENIEPFLFNFFMDKNIIRLPLLFRFFLAKLISKRRSKREAGDSYQELGNQSPLLSNSQKQANALEKLLNLEDSGTFKCFISMRYWHPMAEKTLKDVKKWNPDQVILLPLYPQFSTTTTKSSFEQWDLETRKIKWQRPTVKICCYPWEEGFIEASARNVCDIYEKARIETNKKPRILFSAHGLPEKIIQSGDPYQWQCEQTVKRIIDYIDIDELDWQICYQSRVGPMKWIGPSTEEAIEKAANEDVPIVIFPHAFTQEHVETLVEIEIEYREFAQEKGLKDFYRVPTVGTLAPFIEGLADLVLNNYNKEGIVSHQGKRLCPHSFRECCINN